MPQPNALQRSPKAKAASISFPEPPSPASTPYPLTIVLLTLAIITSLALITRPPPSVITNTMADAEGLPKSYAICSRAGEGRSIYTVDENNTGVQCLVVQGAIIHDTGDLDDVRKRWSAEHDEELEVKYINSGAIVVPGMSDSHCHILEYGASRLIALQDANSVQEVLEILAVYITTDPVLATDRSKVIEGWGFDHTKWESTDGMFGFSAADFDTHPTTRGRQIILTGRDGHTAWVSPSTLALNAPYPKEFEGGVIVRDKDGKEKGVFLDKAMDLIQRPKPTQDDLKKRFNVTVNHALQYGLTSLHDAGFDPMSLAFFKSQAALPIRIYGMSYFDATAPYWGNTTTPLDAHPELGGRLGVRSVKFFADGALRSGGAALYEPYADNPATSGYMRISSDVLENVVPLFLRDGWQVNIHSIGDRANGLVLDAFEAALKKVKVDVKALRPRIEHAQIVADKDMKRFGELGVIASVQPTHATDDMWYAEDRLGPERVKNLYAFRSLIDSGAHIALGSDFPVAEVNPLAGFYAAITRLKQDGTSPHGEGGWFPEQRLTRVEALRGITIDPAYASFTEKHLGSLERGKRADFVVVSKDIMRVPPKEILDAHVLATVIDGRVAYGSI
ncbi:putative amidohydrolase YtcJ [Hypsizygus marmoreus]|uniref:Amidohydrolase YtcJ n=1 Tax=Hypsizygus marmoreus TaxID=39966 RepID=A0A369J9A4_HYPMA|nr:putative amidohydrolase YtcJ [Hypsizygus marmoreus]